MSVKDLQKVPGVGLATAKKLIKAGYGDIEVLACAKPAELARKTGIRPAVAKKLVASAKSGKKKELPSAAAKAQENILSSILDRMADKESTLSIDFSDIEFELGEQKAGATGRVVLTVRTLS